MTKGIKRQLTKAKQVVEREISGIAESGGMYAAGMAGEGYAGGYRDALEDVQTAIEGNSPCRRPAYWRGGL